ncbi:protein kinase [Kitasatospora sp. NPDC056327]|uniref:serine/threonine-protein kinase n=1 Tax=Kitasatospora sp. NPDC056327 TaxID=3345785 RepID=UPI0035E24A1D
MAGDVLDGRYQLIERLGQGGFGVVWRAFDTRMRRPVAVKVINHHGEDQQKAALRFVREACAAGNLSHPHIVTVHDLGEGELAGRRVTYLVMELLVGRTLTAVLRDGPPDPAQSLRWVRQICSALAAAHDAGMVHRDIKPENIMVTEAGAAKVLDFGIAQLDTGAGGLTTTGTLIGSPAYMAPERWTGGRVDGRADLYALGCVLVELCTGVRPFGGDSSPVLMYQHLNEPPPALDPARFGLPGELAGLVAELLAKDPAGRPADARAVERRLAELARVLDEGERSPGAAERAPVAPAGPPGPVPPPEPVQVPGPGPLPGPGSHGVAQAVVYWAVEVAPGGPGTVLPVHPAFAAARAAPGRPRPPGPPLAPTPPPGPDPVREELRRGRLNAYLAPDPADAARLLQAVGRTSAELFGPADRDTLGVWRDFAWYVGRTGDLDLGIRLLTAVVDDLARALGPDDPDVLAARHQLVWCVAESGYVVTAVRMQTQLVAGAEAVPGVPPAGVAEARGRLDAYRAALGEGRGRPPAAGRGEVLELVRRLRDGRFASPAEADTCLAALGTATGFDGFAERVLRAPWCVTPEDLVAELYPA